MNRKLPSWLLLLSRLLIVYQPVSFALTGATALSSLTVRGTPLVAAIVVRLLVTGFSVAAGLALTNLHPFAVVMAKAALVMSAASDILAYTTSFFPNNLPPGDAPFYVGASLIYHGAWLVYLHRSKRVREIFSI